MLQFPPGSATELGDYNVAVSQQVYIEPDVRDRLEKISIACRKRMKLARELNVQCVICRSEGHRVA